MPRLPTSADVQQVNPRVQSDPGVAVPQGAFDSPLGELGPASDSFVRASQRQESREDAVALSDTVIGVNQQYFETFTQFNNERDLSKAQDAQEFGKALSDIRKQAVQNWPGSKDGLARLQVRLGQLENEFISKGAVTGVEVGRLKVSQAAERRIDPLISSVASNPSRDNVLKQIAAVSGQIEDLFPAMDPGTEQAQIRAAQENIALAALTSDIARGRVETASSMLESDLSEFLTPDNERAIRTRISDIQFAKDEVRRWASQIQDVTGRPPTQEMFLAKLGVSTAASGDVVEIHDPDSPTGKSFARKSDAVGKPAPVKDSSKLVPVADANSPTGLTYQLESEAQGQPAPGAKPSEREKRKTQLVERGYSENFAEDVAAGDVIVTTPDNEGNVFTVNRVSNERRPVSDADARLVEADIALNAQKAGQQLRQESQPEQQETPPDTGTFEAAEKGTGPLSKVKAGLSNVFGPFIAGAIFPDTTDARQQIRTFAQLGKTALVNNPKFPVAEQKIVQNLLPDPDAFFRDPDRSVRDLRKLKQQLIQFKEAKQNEVDTGRVTTKRKGELIDQVSNIDEILTFMGGPPVIETQDEVDALEPGANFIWGEDLNVYQKGQDGGS